MKLWLRIIGVTVVYILSVSGLWPQASERGPRQSTVLDQDIGVIDFEELQYPHFDQYAAEGFEDIVVVRVKLDDKGRVSEAEPIAGKQNLISDCLANVKKWRFQPKSKAAVVVYHFRPIRGLCKSPSSFFTFQRPNLVTVAGCSPKLEGSVGQVSSLPAAGETEVLEFEELRYPPLARQARLSGVVVVQANLDDKGGVSDAVAVSGNRVLIPDCLSNVRKWRFRPNASRRATVVYNFRFPCEGLLYKSENQHQFVLEPPNFATITATPVTIQTQQ
jgi:TonB family protein